MAVNKPNRTQENASELVKLAVVSTGTYLSTLLLLRLVKNPVILLGTGMLTGFYISKNRKQIIETLVEAKQHGLELLDKSPDESEDDI